jgi:hypothetical protein
MLISDLKEYFSKNFSEKGFFGKILLSLNFFLTFSPHLN